MGRWKRCSCTRKRERERMGEEEVGVGRVKREGREEGEVGRDFNFLID